MLTLPASVRILALAALATACSSTSTGTGTGDGGTSGGSPPGGQEQACLETIAGFARAATRCEGTYEANYDSLLQSAAGGDCKKVVSIRDEAALRRTCLPSLQSLSCADLAAANVDPSCKRQLIRSAGFTPTLGPASTVAGSL